MKSAQRGVQRSRVLPQRIMATHLKTAKNLRLFHRVARRGFAPSRIMLLDKPVFRINDRHFALDVLPGKQRRLQHIPQSRDAVGQVIGGNVEEKALWRASVVALTLPPRRWTQAMSRSSP